jgi:predicted Zn-dependent protease
MIWLIPIENRRNQVDRGLLETICSELHKALKQECIVQRSMKPSIVGRVPGNNSYIGARLLEALPVQKDKIILGITSLDLSMIGYDYTTGLSDPLNKRAIVSISRLQSNPDDNLSNGQQDTDRVVKRIIHEVGHTHGLLHCDDKSCVMNFSETPEDMDEKSPILCKKCESAIRERYETWA